MGPTGRVFSLSPNKTQRSRPPVPTFELNFQFSMVLTVATLVEQILSFFLFHLVLKQLLSLPVESVRDPQYIIKTGDSTICSRCFVPFPIKILALFRNQ